MKKGTCPTTPVGVIDGEIVSPLRLMQGVGDA